VGCAKWADIVHIVDTLDNVKSVNSVDNVSSVNSFHNVHNEAAARSRFAGRGDIGDIVDMKVLMSFLWLVN